MIQYLIFGGKMPFNLQKLKLKIVISALFFTFSTVAYAETTDNADSTAKADKSVEAQFHTEESQTENEHSAESGHHGAHGVDGATLPLWSIIPFVGILLSIALFPLIAPHFWHHHFPKISAAWAVLFAVPFVVVYGGRAWHDILHIYLLDYIPFIILLWGLFTVSGGILIKGSLKGTPQVNFMIILIGTMIASWIGTTGAAMVMIRPLLRANENRKYKVHLVVFFIFLVANIGGLLTPLGDPPLFLGFLHGVSFFWTLSLFPQMMLVVVLLLALFYLFDSYYYRKEDIQPVENEKKEPLKVKGAFNFIFLLGIIIGVIFSGTVRLGEINIFGVHVAIQNIIRDVWIVLMGLLSLKLTKTEIRDGNGFNWFPIQEVAYLFAGIFMTIIPALAILKAGEQGALAALVTSVKTEIHFFWVTGGLSSFLDNAPTYLTFFNSALGKLGLTEDQIRAAFIAGDVAVKYPEFIKYLTAISLGAVFMGANTYIGNAPNFMVKSIAEESGISMPSFFGYMIKYSIPILLPVFVVVTIIFL
jgi:Na+/H+ antiporter NhaD/arsenite permease-like protein